MERPDLAPYAALSQNSLGRLYPEPFKDGRPAFERDRDRIIHCAAFRRLEYKTQVFINHEGDYYRTRLTHSLEVAQISRGIARQLKLNEDLAEALSLAHDLGHTPFGHTGEHVLNELMQDYGGFEHNRQSLRIVDYLEERYPDFNGLNLTFETREGIIKHSSEYDRPGDKSTAEFLPKLQPTMEAQLIDLADEIAYNNHDIDDGLKAGYLNLPELEEVELWQDASSLVKDKFSGLDEERYISQTISHLIGILIDDLVSTTRQRIEDGRILSLDDVRNAGNCCVAFSEETGLKNKGLKGFLWKKLYTHYKVERMRVKSTRFIRLLFESYAENPSLLPHNYQAKFGTDGQMCVICDYIAGMTDRYAMNEYKRLFEPYERV